jgi:signal transduction histidine kinase/ActR/RegA family two-component response regulator
MLKEATQRWMNELSAQGIFVTDAELTIQLWNHWLEVCSGYSAAQMIGRKLFDVYPDLVNRGLKKYYEEALSGQVRLLSQRLHHYLLPMPPQIDDPAFAQMQQSVRIAPLIQEEQIIGTITVIDDVTERIAREEQLMRLYARERAARQEAEAANRTKDEFLATVSHELRTPLNTISGWLQILRNRDVDAFSLAQGLDVIERSMNAQSTIIEDILDVSRIITGKLNLDVKRVDLATIIEAALDSVQLAASAKGLSLQLQKETDDAYISGDANRLQQIVWNLVSNAIKFTPREGAVTIRLARLDAQLELSVSDTGKGIRPEFLPYVFDRFRQADSTSTRQHGGLGLGLAIVRHLVEIHGGTVQALSAGEGLGATFIIKLPTAANTGSEPALIQAAPDPMNAEAILSAAKASPADENAIPSLNGLRVLVVDDDADARNMLQILLTQFGAETRVSNSARGALQTLNQWQPDVLISDIGMPHEDGIFLIRQVKALQPEQGGSIPAIALTGFARPEDLQQLLTAGYQASLPKPVDVLKLVYAINSLSKPNAKPSSIPFTPDKHPA